MIGPRRLRALAAVVAAIVAAMVTVAGCGNDPAHPATTSTGEYHVVTVNVHGRVTEGREA